MRSSQSPVLLAAMILLGASACSCSRVPVHTETGSWEVDFGDSFWLEDEQQVWQFLKDLEVLSTECCRAPEQPGMPPDPTLRYLVILYEVRNVGERPATYEGVRQGAYNGMLGRLDEPGRISHASLNRNKGTFEPLLAPNEHVLDAFVFRLLPGAERFDLWIETFSMHPPPLFPLTLPADRIRIPQANRTP